MGTATGGYGGIGRRARFRFWCPRRAGSSPVIRIIKNSRKHKEFLIESNVFGCFYFEKSNVILLHKTAFYTFFVMKFVTKYSKKKEYSEIFL